MNQIFVQKIHYHKIILCDFGVKKKIFRVDHM